jgi:hypothetical protein
MNLKRKHTLLVTFVYPGVLWNITKMKSSIKYQTYKEFDTLIVLDSITRMEIDIPEEWQTINNDYNFDIPTLRYMAVRYAIKENYEYIVFLDADDSMDDTRIEAVLDKFGNYDFVVNEVVPVNLNGELIGQPVLKKLFPVNIIDDYKKIYENNLIGFSNSAIRVSVLDSVKIPNIIIAVDWYLYSVLLLDNRCGRFIDETYTYYTQHDTNTVGLKTSLNKDLIKYYLDVKIRHFFALELYSRSNKKRHQEVIYGYLNNLLQLQRVIEKDSKLELYKKMISSNSTDFKGWWGPLKVSKEIIRELVSEN